MGLGSSKKASSSSSSSSSATSDSSGHGLGEKNENRRRKRGRINFTSPCFGMDHQFKRKGVNSKSKHSHCIVDEEEKANSKHSEKLASSSSSSSQIPEFHTANSELSEENRESTSQENPTTTCPSTSSTTINADNNSKCRFKLNRALSLGSSLSHNLLSNDDNNTNTSINENITQQDPNSETRRNNLVESERNAQRNRDVLENSVRFSRTLSVGRLRDRVLRRPPFPEGLFSPVLLDETAVNTRRVLRRAGSLSNNISDLNSDNDNENHGELFERRRRIRSQVRALQRLGSRFENLTGHERSCVLSGRHRTDRCTCRARNQDETSTRSSISRIVMLAEALFEVLDEIQQQSVVLSSSRQPFSTVGSVPAPKEIVESLPVKFYEKNPKNKDEICQCYICLVEYEEGDGMRVLPCNHEFHLTCIDKWLKEIHRVCPLCRGDVCKA